MYNFHKNRHHFVTALKMGWPQTHRPGNKGGSKVEALLGRDMVQTSAHQKELWKALKVCDAEDLHEGMGQNVCNSASKPCQRNTVSLLF